MAASLKDTRFLRNAFGRFASGVTIVSCQSDIGIHGMTANSFISVSLEPARALISVAKSAQMHERLMRQERFGLSVLSEGQSDISTHFAGRPIAGLTPDFEYQFDVPVLAGALSWMVCKRQSEVEIGDHTLFIGDLIDCGYKEEQAPLVYFGGRYNALAPVAQ
ncbi:MAG: flavin reductase family protein [Pseudomonadota bacterium]